MILVPSRSLAEIWAVIGSMHNFMDYAVAKRVGCTTHALSEVGVTIANGDCHNSFSLDWDDHKNK